jgi:hypothetical protein
MDTKVQQHTTVGRGLALGAVLSDNTAISAQKMTLELGFRRAWKAWPASTYFPSINTGPHRDDVLTILSKSRVRQRALYAYWASEWPFVPVLRQLDWSSEEIAEAIDERVSASEWKDLVAAWVATLDKSRRLSKPNSY